MTVTETVLNKSIEAAEGRIELKLIDRLSAISDQIGALATRIGGLEGKQGTLQSTLDAKPGTWTLVGTVAGAAATLLAAGLGIAAFAGDRFDGGMSAANTYAEQTAAAAERDRKQTEALQSVSDKLDKLAPAK